VNIWTVSNQKGGVGKTTTVVTLGGLLAQQGKRVLLLDLDPQGSMTSYFRLDPDGSERSVYSLFEACANHTRVESLEMLLHDTGVKGLFLLPASTAMATLDRQLGTREGMGLVIKQTLARLESQFDYVLMDCPPMLGVLMVNALAACQRLLIPVLSAAADPGADGISCPEGAGSHAAYPADDYAFARRRAPLHHYPDLLRSPNPRFPGRTAYHA
jgi:chromosome partitioning protein